LADNIRAAQNLVDILGGAAAAWPLVAGAQDNIARLGPLTIRRQFDILQFGPG
jgi:hypothetical protein